MDSNLHFPQRRLIELRMEHAELNASIDRTGSELQMDELSLRRLKKQRLSLRDEISRLEVGLLPDETA
ncbi:MAG: YdcH family protein [Gammaproteobacteria bacterium]|nr:YdcH family protein [Gammaproteobacteria bacterium]MBU0786504.1 YdcH family protein [Gammaproteobacteria bacterium]MBU0817112.1 YdcH family protein [Gammaproteobacteria bacterium]MBU1787767.1 YdcH family protein [Gammaproteobacteria bacterium]